MVCFRFWLHFICVSFKIILGSCVFTLSLRCYRAQGERKRFQISVSWTHKFPEHTLAPIFRVLSGFMGSMCFFYSWRYMLLRWHGMIAVVTLANMGEKRRHYNRTKNNKARFVYIFLSLCNHVTLYGLAFPRLLHSRIDHIKTFHPFKHGYAYDKGRWVVLYALVSSQWPDTTTGYNAIPHDKVVSVCK